MNRKVFVLCFAIVMFGWTPSLCAQSPPACTTQSDGGLGGGTAQQTCVYQINSSTQLSGAIMVTHSYVTVQCGNGSLGQQIVLTRTNNSFDQIYVGAGDGS